MNAEAVRKLERLRHYGTLYEVTMAHPDGRTYLVGYTAKGRAGLMRMARQVGPAVVKATGEERFTVGKRAADGITLGAWRVNFTGRTEREAIVAGEWPFVNRVAEAIG